MLLSGCQSANQRVEADAILRPNVVAGSGLIWPFQNLVQYFFNKIHDN